jgi:hypothetical protein
MNIKHSPQRSDNVVEYDFGNDKITVTVNNESDTFDFSGFTDGIAENIETSLPVNPIISAEKKEGILHLELINFIGADATEDERFPTWQEV